MVDVRVVTVAHGRHHHLAQQLRLLAGSDPDAGHVVVALDDPGIKDVVRHRSEGRTVEVVEHPGDPRGLPLAAARNRGVAHALEQGADLVVLLDVDCVVGAGTLARYADAATAIGRAALLCGPVTYLAEGVTVPSTASGLAPLRRPHPARPDPAPGDLVPGGDLALFWSLSAAVTPGTWERLGGFCEDYVGYGGEDTDLGRVARGAGVDLVWVGGADAFHQHHPVSAPPVEHLDAIVRNARLFHARWGEWPMPGWLEAFAERGLVRWTPTELERVDDTAA